MDAFDLTEAEKRLLLELARESIRDALDNRSRRRREDLTPALLKKSGAFVTLTMDGNLRGCIGHILPVDPLWVTVYNMARAAAFEDPRFPSLRREELDLVEIEISVLSPPWEIPSYLEFQVGIHGIILEKGYHQAVFLPQVAVEQGWDREKTLTHLALKAGLPPDGWHEGCTWRVFTALVFAEKDFQ
jgi:AmmeMemoRadiSam system protein A